MKLKLTLVAVLTVALGAAAHAQLPIVGSTGTFSGQVNALDFASGYSFVNGQPSSYPPTGLYGYTSYGKNSTGDFDFVAINGGAAPTFYWYYATGAGPTFTVPMFLDSAENLHIPNGGIVALTLQATQFLKAGAYTVATIPSASSSGAGAQVVVTDCALGSVSQSLCTGGGSNVMIAVSNGTTWSVH